MRRRGANFRHAAEQKPLSQTSLMKLWKKGFAEEEQDLHLGESFSFCSGDEAAAA
jgi:hypothetical protein